MSSAALFLAACGCFYDPAAGPAGLPGDIPATQPAMVAIGDLPIADGFDFPTGPPDAVGYYDAQPFGGEHRHLGSDWNGLGGGDSDLGDPVFSAADGVVTAAGDHAGGWGGVVRVVHRLAGADDAPEQVVETLYAHLDTFDVGTNERVTRGQRLGTMGNVGGRYPAHLHFELRARAGEPLGKGYGDPGLLWLDPTAFITAHRPTGSAPDTAGFTSLAPGLDLGRFPSPVPSFVGDSVITVVRVDPAAWSVEVLAASREHPGDALTAPEWAERHALTAVINAGMFGTDHSTATFALTDEGEVNNPALSPKAGSVLLAEPPSPKGPSARLLDLRCDDLDALRPQYGSLVQSYRLLDCAAHPTWGENGKVWSHALLGADGDGRLLLIHARSPWSTRQFTEILLDLPLDLRRLHYAEGGPEASLYLHHGDTVVAAVGSWETGFFERDDNRAAWPLPNVIGVRER
jgi:murein DD-endopeptidase MepM/ murein hydrolase activator NlpD